MPRLLTGTVYERDEENERNVRKGRNVKKKKKSRLMLFGERRDKMNGFPKWTEEGALVSSSVS